MEHKEFRLASFKALDQAQGIFEALVAVFGNVDRGGDKILPGAFTKTLAEWEASGEPIPVIFAHEWDNLDAHIGKVLQAKETPEGLFVKGQLDMDEDFAARVWKKMQQRTLRQFSFAYDVRDSTLAKQQDGSYVNELKDLELLEVGPCLVGMNPATELLGVKRGARNSAKDAARIQAIHDAACDLGAKCAEVNDSGDGDEGASGDQGKAKGPRPSTLAARVAIDLLQMTD